MQVSSDLELLSLVQSDDEFPPESELLSVAFQASQDWRYLSLAVKAFQDSRYLSLTVKAKNFSLTLKTSQE